MRKGEKLGLDDLGVRGVLLHGGDALLHDCFAWIGLALADDLSIARLQDKVDFAVLGGLRFETGRIGGIALHGGDATLRARQGLVHLAGQDDLAVPSLEVKQELAVGRSFDFELSCHCVAPLF